MVYKVGTLLNINGLEAKVIGYIQYSNPQDGNKAWTEYRLKTKKGECWLSCDEVYNEYSISWPANQVRGKIGPEWHKVDKGTQVVRSYSGDVDVDPGETASFIEYEDQSTDHTLSVEIWSDGTEYSKGEYIEKKDILEVGFEKPAKSMEDIVANMIMVFTVFAILCAFLSPLISRLSTNKSISKYLSKSSLYTHETSITGNEKQKADVYVYYTSATTDSVAKDIIQGINGYTESVTQKDETADEEIAIMTKDEYCLVYHPEEEEDVVYVQVSNRKYNYTSSNAPYRISTANATWYRNHYYSAGYSSDASSYKRTPSAYTMYEGTTIHNIGNGYFDTYANSVKQSSINSRNSSSGGTSSGK